MLKAVLQPSRRAVRTQVHPVQGHQAAALRYSLTRVQNPENTHTKKLPTPIPLQNPKPETAILTRTLITAQ